MQHLTSTLCVHRGELGPKRGSVVTILSQLCHILLLNFYYYSMTFQRPQYVKQIIFVKTLHQFLSVVFLLSTVTTCSSGAEEGFSS